MSNPVSSCPITQEEFDAFRQWIHGIAGIRLSEQKKALVMGRLAARLRHHRLASYGEYYRLLTTQRDEEQVAIDLLTTNQTQFFREPKHFEFLQREVLPRHPVSRTLRIWSAASSSGEEPYSIAMAVAGALGEHPWEVVASDLSTRMLERAQKGLYKLSHADGIPPELLRAYCLKGVGEHAGTFLVDPALRQRVRFLQVNLNAPLPDLGSFDVIFLRNVMIYFDLPTKRQVTARIARHLRPGGYLFIGHSESLNGVNDELAPVRPAIFRKP